MAKKGEKYTKGGLEFKVTEERKRRGVREVFLLPTNSDRPGEWVMARKLEKSSEYQKTARAA